MLCPDLLLTKDGLAPTNFRCAPARKRASCRLLPAFPITIEPAIVDRRRHETNKEK